MSSGFSENKDFVYILAGYRELTCQQILTRLHYATLISSVENRNNGAMVNMFHVKTNYNFEGSNIRNIVMFSRPKYSAQIETECKENAKSSQG